MTKEKILLLTLAVIQFSHITYFMILMPLGPQLMDSFNILPSQFALLVSTYTFSAGTSGFVGAFFIDRFDQPKPRPEVAIQRDSAIGFARMLRELDLDIAAPTDRSRPPSLLSNRGL